MAHDVFISYSHKDKSVADAICSRLERGRIRCWYAPRDIPSGADWASSIVDAINSTKVMVLVFSDHSNSSDQVLREVSLAVKNKTAIVPFKITDSLPTKSMEYYLETVQWLDASGAPLSEGVESLYKVVGPILGVPTDDQQRGASSDIPKCPRCGTPVAPSYAFCLGCGLPIKQAHNGAGGTTGSNSTPNGDKEKTPEPVRGTDVNVSVVVSAAFAQTGGVVKVPYFIDWKSHSVKVRVPAGAKDGGKLRVHGRGNPGLNGGAAGDLIVTILLKEQTDATYPAANDQQRGASPSMLKCPRCGGSVAPGHSFCRSCGLPIEQVRMGVGGNRGAGPTQVPQKQVPQANVALVANNANAAGMPSAKIAGCLCALCLLCFFPLGFYNFYEFYKMMRAIDSGDSITANNRYKVIKITTIFIAVLVLISLIALFISMSMSSSQ